MNGFSKAKVRILCIYHSIDVKIGELHSLHFAHLKSGDVNICREEKGCYLGQSMRNNVDGLLDYEKNNSC